MGREFWRQFRNWFGNMKLWWECRFHLFNFILKIFDIIASTTKVPFENKWRYSLKISLFQKRKLPYLLSQMQSSLEDKWARHRGHNLGQQLESHEVSWAHPLDQVFLFSRMHLSVLMIINWLATSHKLSPFKTFKGFLQHMLEEGKTEKFLVRSASGPYAASLQLDETELSKSLAQIPPWVFNINAASASTRTA